MLDTTREVEVPEGITLSLPVASLVSRSLGYLIDFLICWIFVEILEETLVFLGEFGAGIYYLLVFIVVWFYPVLFEVFYHGQTPGKKVMGVMVINDDGTPIDWSSSIVRNLLRFADFLPLFYAFGLLSMMFSRDFKRLGDFAAGTLVVHKLEQIDKSQKLNVEGLAPKVPLTVEEQSAIIEFTERAPKMSKSRVNELAGYLGPWLDQDKMKKGGESASVQLSRIAKWLRGHV